MAGGLFKCKWLDKSEIWERADQFRSTYWEEDTLPVEVEEITELKLKLNIIPYKDLVRLADIDAYLNRDLTGITVDHDRFLNEKYQNRLRFSFAHELGHLILHKDIYAAEHIESIEDWKRVILSRDYSPFEFQANEFAGRLLVPRATLSAEVLRCHELLKKFDVMDILETDPKGALQLIAPSLCKPFGVSEDVIVTRVWREELWPPSF